MGLSGLKPRRISDYRLFIFDWDGTLNSMRLTLRINEAVKRSLHMWNRDSDIKDVSKMDYDMKKRLEREVRKNNMQTFIFDILLNFSSPTLHNDTVKLLKRLRQDGKKIALFSNGRSARVVKELKYFGITGYFDMIVSARDIHALKPNPTGLKAITDSMKIRPYESLYIGDMVDDIITAKLANVHSCAVADGFDSYHILKSARPDHIFKSIEEMLRAMK